jgi:DNA-binding CsgD family transcriptional regulator
MEHSDESSRFFYDNLKYSLTCVSYKNRKVNSELLNSITYNLSYYFIKNNVDNYNLFFKKNSQECVLSSREKKTMILTANGKTSLEIAKEMFISVNTVNFHIKNTLVKLKSKNKAQAVATAILLGLI